MTSGLPSKQGCNLAASRESGQVIVVDVLAAPLDWDARALYARVRAAVIAANGDGDAASGKPHRCAGQRLRAVSSRRITLLTRTTCRPAHTTFLCQLSRC